MEIDRNTKLSDILKEYPWLPDELIKIDGRFKVLKTPVAKMLIGKSTVADAVEKTGLEEKALLEELNKIIEAHEE